MTFSTEARFVCKAGRPIPECSMTARAILAVQTPGAPRLSLASDLQLGTATISWPSSASGFILQQNSDLTTTNWVTAPQSITDNGTLKFILINQLVGRQFYRLMKAGSQ
jgi:hypothetical protein